jgi:hypothetical protein
MKNLYAVFLIFILNIFTNPLALCQTSPDNIKFVRQSVRRMIFDEEQSIPLAALDPARVIDLSVMHPIQYYSEHQPETFIEDNQLVIQSGKESEAAIWFGGFNPFATYSIDISSCSGEGSIGFEFSDAQKEHQFIVTVRFNDSFLSGAHLKVIRNQKRIVEEAISVNMEKQEKIPPKIILQMLGSGLVLYAESTGFSRVIGQCDFNKHLDLRKKEYIQSFQSNLFVKLNQGTVILKHANMTLSPGVGLADIRAMTYENGEPLLDQGRLWYTMSIRGRALPHHIQGVFSMNPSVFDIKLEGIVLFDRNDGILRNEIASHIFYDREKEIWRGMTTGFSAFANPEKEEKQLLAIESVKDPRFGFSIMHATPFGIVGDIEDPHIIFDEESEKWRILTCENHDGYKAVILESDEWNKDYKRISGPVDHNSTGTSIQKIGDKFYCFSGSSERNIFIYSYPDLDEIGTLKMDLPPWNETSGTRVWPNVVQLPDGYPWKYVALMMDRINYPGMHGPHWSYGAIYLYYGYE